MTEIDRTTQLKIFLNEIQDKNNPLKITAEKCIYWVKKTFDDKLIIQTIIQNMNTNEKSLIRFYAQKKYF